MEVQGAILGTPKYMSPEQAKGIDVVPASDIYSLGIVVFQCLTGELPYKGKDALQLIGMHITDPIPNILTLNSNLPAEYQSIFEKAMAKAPTKRFQTATEFIQTLAKTVDTNAIIGQTLGNRYLIQQKIGEGGFSQVYLADDIQQDKQVAIKIINRNFSNESSFQKRFEREVEIMSTLTHPNIIPLLETGNYDGQLFMVTPYMSGGSLANHLKQGNLSLEKLTAIIAQIANALDYAHTKNIIHRDLKPSNILFDEDNQAHIADFGIAKMTKNEDNTATDLGFIVGTVAYMSPEQAKGVTVGPASDIYSLGIILFRSLTSKLPYENQTPMGLLYLHVNAPIPDILTFNPDLPPDCQLIIEKVLAKDPTKRFQTAGKLAEALAQVAEGIVLNLPSEPNISPITTKITWPSRKVVIGIVIVTVCVLISYFYLIPWLLSVWQWIIATPINIVITLIVVNIFLTITSSLANVVFTKLIVRKQDPTSLPEIPQWESSGNPTGGVGVNWPPTTMEREPTSISHRPVKQPSWGISDPPTEISDYWEDDNRTVVQLIEQPKLPELLFSDESSQILPPISGATAFLVVHTDMEKKKYELLETTIIIGRDKENYITLEYENVSRQHSMIKTYNNNQFILSDLNSFNGTFVNGKPISDQHTLQHKDKIVVGGCYLEFRYANLYQIQAAFDDTWQDLKDVLIQEDHAEIEQAAEELASQLARHLDLVDDYFHKVNAQLKWATSFTLNTGTIFDQLPFATHFPVIYSHKEILAWEDIEQLQPQLKSGSNQLLIILPIETVTAKTSPLLQTARARAIDLILAAYDDLKEIILAPKPRQAFRHLIITRSNVQSPFTLSGATPHQMFFGRNQELTQIMGRIHETSFVLTGNRRVGKTSILHALRDHHLPEAGFYILFQDCANFKVDSFLAAPIPAKNWSPTSPPNAPTTFEQLFQAPPTDKPLVLLLDEADSLIMADQTAQWSLLNRLRGLNNARQMQVILSGANTFLELFQDNSGPLYNFGERIRVGNLDRMAVEELVARPLKQWEIQLQDESAILDRIWQLTAGHPNVVQRLCSRLIALLNEQNKRTITLADIEQVIQNQKFIEEDFIEVYLGAATPLEKVLVYLLAYQPQMRTVKAMRQYLKEQFDCTPSMIDTRQALKFLVEVRSILQQVGEGYKFAFEAFPHVLAEAVTLDDVLEGAVETYQESVK